MRCLNCGWENAIDAKKCIKCNISLMGTMGSGNNGGVPVPPPSPNDAQQDLSKTISAPKSGAQAWDAPAPLTPSPLTSEDAGVGLSDCPYCKYPLTSDFDQCPNCHKELKSKERNLVSPQVKPNYSGTINPYQGMKGGNCHLKPVPRINEAALPDLNFSGDTVQLNRNNVEPGNNTITSRVQATLQLLNGEWYLVDNSEQQTTFVRASNPVKLTKGDIILMGDRKFIFDC